MKNIQEREMQYFLLVDQITRKLKELVNDEIQKFMQDKTNDMKDILAAITYSLLYTYGFCEGVSGSSNPINPIVNPVIQTGFDDYKQVWEEISTSTGVN